MQNSTSPRMLLLASIVALFFPACSSRPEFDCQDSDGDGYGTNCPAGPDCDDSSAACNTDCSDADQDSIPDCNDSCIDVNKDGICDSQACISDPGCDSEGLVRCISATQFQTCTETEPDCYKWSDPDSCPQWTQCQADIGCVCQNTCETEGQRACFGEDSIQFRECQRTASDCLVWGDPQSCPENSVCVEGVCEETCTSDADCSAVGDRRCYSAVKVVICEEIEPGCIRFGEPQSCPGDYVCQEGECVADCASECDSIGQKRCYDGQHEQTCYEHVQACLKWDEPIACPAHQHCSGDFCECDHACDPGETDCTTDGSDSIAVSCQTDENGCRFLAYQTCAPGTECQQGQCEPVCQSDPGCSEIGLTDCASADSVRTCLEIEPDCLQWSDAEQCGVHQLCNEGACACIEQEGCTQDGLRICEDAHHYKICQTDSQGCLAFGDAVPCPGDQICNDGLCSTQCVSDPDCNSDGDRRCVSSSEFQICELIEEDCLKWASAQSCQEHKICDGDSSECVCANPCVEGEITCDPTGLVSVCVSDEADCTYFETSECPPDLVCVAGECIELTSPVVDCGTVTFNLVDREHQEVFASGTFNDWSETDKPLTLSGGVWSAIVEVESPGSYEYKFIIDGLYQLDPLNPETVGQGYFTNSVFHIESVENCSELGAWQCLDFDTLQQCQDLQGCLSWVSLPECQGWDAFCQSSAECGSIISPQVAGASALFRYKDKGNQTVSVTGSFTEPAWDEQAAIPMDKTVGYFESPLVPLDEGTHLYKFIVDGNPIWVHDPVNPEKVPDGLGGFNSIVTIDSQCSNDCEAGQTECQDLGSELVCQLGEDGCYHYELHECTSLPVPQYCLPDRCQLFPVVEGSSVTFYYQNDTAIEVKVAGTFSEPPWSPEEALLMVGTEGVFSASLADLAAGRYEYKFIVDGQWLHDPLNTGMVDDGHGGFNSVFSIGL